MGLSFRLAIAMVSLVILTAFGVGVVIYRGMTTSELPHGIERMQAHAGLLAKELETYVETARADIRALAGMPTVSRLSSLHQATISEQDSAGKQVLRSETADQFAAFLRAKQNYMQIRLLDALEGREIVRVERKVAQGLVTVTPEPLLQVKAHRPYYAQTLGLPEGDIYVSALDYTRENYALEKPYVPTIRLAMAIRTADNINPLGMVIINVDMRPIFQRLKSASPTNGKLYLVDEFGNYLIHPDETRVFGFEFGKPFRLQDDWSQLGDAVNAAEPSSLEISDAGGTEFGATVWPVRLAGSRKLAIVEIVPVSALLAQASTVTTSTVNVAILAALISGLVAAAIGLSFARPLQRVTRALDGTGTHPSADLPIRASGEIGALARAFYGYLERESLLGAIVNSSFDAIITETLDGVITSWNPAAERLFGYTADEAIGANVEMLVPPEYRAELATIKAGALKGQRLSRFESVRIDKEGNQLEVALTVSPVKDPKGEIIGVSAIAHDIGRDRAMGKRMAELQAQAAHASRVSMAGKMASAMVHELGQPLTAIGNFIKSAEQLLAQEQLAGEGNVVHLIGRAGEQTQHAKEVLVRLREFIGNRSTRLEMQDLNEIVEAGLESVLSGEPQNLEVVRNYDKNLPKLQVDKTQVRQVVVNLIRNAIEAMESSPTRILTITTKANGDEIDVIVSDTGPNLNREARGRLFDPFITSKAGGMGIGLQLSRAIIEAHGGQLMMEPNEGDGNMFRFVLPNRHA